MDLRPSNLFCKVGVFYPQWQEAGCNNCRNFTKRRSRNIFASTKTHSPLRSTDRTAAYEAADGSSILSGGTKLTELWQRWSMRRTENPENEVQVLKAPHDMVIVALHSPPPDIAQVAKRLTRRSAKPVCAGSNPALSSKNNLYICGLIKKKRDMAMVLTHLRHSRCHSARLAVSSDANRFHRFNA